MLSGAPNISLSFFENSFAQPNVISRLNPPNVTDDTPTILLAGHLDSTSPLALFRAPGADDDASGTAVMMHVMDILARSGWVQTTAK
jgi:bacterial leucyl aminopeptidase